MDLSQFNTFVSEKKGILQNLISNQVFTSSFRIEKHINPEQEKWILYGSEYVGGYRRLVIYSHDEISFITEYCSELINLNFNSVLVGGLGLGMIPYVLKNECSVLDVIEKNNELIETIKSFNYLDGVNIINGDIFDFTPNKIYDLIILDIWTETNFNDIQQQIRNALIKYIPYLSEEGLVYIPINKINNKTIWTQEDLSTV